MQKWINHSRARHLHILPDLSFVDNTILFDKDLTDDRADSQFIIEAERKIGFELWEVYQFNVYFSFVRIWLRKSDSFLDKGCPVRKENEILKWKGGFMKIV